MFSSGAWLLVSCLSSSGQLHTYAHIDTPNWTRWVFKKKKTLLEHIICVVKFCSCLLYAEHTTAGTSDTHHSKKQSNICVCTHTFTDSLTI